MERRIESRQLDFVMSATGDRDGRERDKPSPFNAVLHLWFEAQPRAWLCCGLVNCSKIHVEFIAITVAKSRG